MHLSTMVNLLSALAAVALLTGCPHKEKPTPAEPHVGVDLEAQGNDPNGFALNPSWQQSAPNLLSDCKPRAVDPAGFVFRTPECTSQLQLISLNRRPKRGIVKKLCRFDDSTSVRGHLNWFPATYRGVLRWRGFQGGPFRDQDVDLDLFPLEARGLTAGNAGSHAIELEFNSTEVFNSLRGASWPAGEWKPVLRYLREIAKNHAAFRDSLAARLNGSLTVATGLFGLDGVHSYHAELHPLWAMAVRTSGRSAREKWILMARNLGDEGMCASEQMLPLPLAKDTFSFLLPLRTGADTVRATGGFLRYAGGAGVTPSVVMTPHGVVVSVPLPSGGTPSAAGNPTVLLGELELTWLRADGSAITTELEPLSLADYPNAPVAGGGPALLAENDPAEEELQRLVDSLPPAAADSAFRDWHKSMGWVWYLDAPQNPWTPPLQHRLPVRVLKEALPSLKPMQVDWDTIPPDTALARRGMSKDAVACKYLKRYLPDCDR